MLIIINLFPIANVFLGHQWGNVNWGVLGPRECSLLLIARGEAGANGARGTQDGKGASYAGCT